MSVEQLQQIQTNERINDFENKISQKFGETAVGVLNLDEFDKELNDFLNGED